MDELVEVLTEDGTNTFEVIDKLIAHRDGICHGISAVAVINNGRLLIQRRAKTKRDEAGKWDLSGAGHINVSETPSMAAIRELNEELGITVEESDLKLVDTYLNKIKLGSNTFINHFTYLFLTDKDINIDNIKLDESEVSEIRFVNKEEFIDLFNNNEMVEAIKYCKGLSDYLD